MTVGAPVHFDRDSDPAAIAGELQNRVATIGNQPIDQF